VTANVGWPRVALALYELARGPTVWLDAEPARPADDHTPLVAAATTPIATASPSQAAARRLIDDLGL
jgi:hypothetical protein